MNLTVDTPVNQAVIEHARAYYASLPTIAPGLVTHCSLHWAATPYGWARQRAIDGSVIPYNAVADVAPDGSVILVPGMDPRRNARDIDPSETADVDYCASCWHRNSHGTAVSISALYRGGPADFGPYPLTELLVDTMCGGAAAIAKKYDLDATDPKVIFTHGLAAIWDAYFWGDPTDDGDTRGDLSALEAHPEMTMAQLKVHAVEVNTLLGHRIHTIKLAI